MKTPSETDVLNEMIILLHNKQVQDLQALKQQTAQIYENMQPINILKNTFQEVGVVPDLKNNILNTIIGLTTGYISKKIIIGNSHNPIKRILGTILEFTIANVVAKNSTKIITVVEALVSQVATYNSKPKDKLPSGGGGL